MAPPPPAGGAAAPPVGLPPAQMAVLLGGMSDVQATVHALTERLGGVEAALRSGGGGGRARGRPGGGGGGGGAGWGGGGGVPAGASPAM